MSPTSLTGRSRVALFSYTACPPLPGPPRPGDGSAGAPEGGFRAWASDSWNKEARLWPLARLREHGSGPVRGCQRPDSPPGGGGAARAPVWMEGLALLGAEGSPRREQGAPRQESPAEPTLERGSCPQQVPDAE